MEHRYGKSQKGGAFFFFFLILADWVLLAACGT